MANQKTLKNFEIGKEYQWTELQDFGDYVGSCHEFEFENGGIHQSIIAIEEDEHTAVFIFTSATTSIYFYQCIFNTAQKKSK